MLGKLYLKIMSVNLWSGIAVVKKVYTANFDITERNQPVGVMRSIQFSTESKIEMKKILDCFDFMGLESLFDYYLTFRESVKGTTPDYISPIVDRFIEPESEPITVDTFGIKNNVIHRHYYMSIQHLQEDVEYWANFRCKNRTEVKNVLKQYYLRDADYEDRIRFSRVEYVLDENDKVNLVYTTLDITKFLKGETQ